MNLEVAESLRSAKNRCSELGLRFTPKREQVFLSLLRCRRAVSAYELVDLYYQDYQEKISAVTVYRVLEFLESVKLVHKLTLANKFVVCSHICDKDDHEIIQFLICERCFRVDELDIDPSLYGQLNSNATNNGFEPQNSVLEMTCICNTCNPSQPSLG
ncbi:MAG: Fur family transcriptional regulator [Pseudomonadota bacterium]